MWYVMRHYMMILVLLLYKKDAWTWIYAMYVYTCTHVQLLRAMDKRSLSLYATMYMHEGKCY